MKLELGHHIVHIATGGRAPNADAPALLFLHGSGQSHLTWVLQSRYFAYEGYNIIAPDFPGHGPVSYTQLRAHETPRQIAYSVFGL